MLATGIAQIHQLATSQGRPAPLTIHTQFTNQTDNRSPRLAHHRRATKICWHETATTGATAAQLCHRHRSREIIVARWNEILDPTDCYIFVRVETDIAFAQGISAREDLGWDSAACAQAFRSVEVVGPNNGSPISRELELVIVQYMWWLNDRGFPIEKWRGIYDTHSRIGRFAAPPEFPNQKRGRKSDPRGYNPSDLVLKALGTTPSPIPEPMKGIWKVNVSTAHANVRTTPSLSSRVTTQLDNGVNVSIIEWKHGDFVGGSDWWGRRREGGWIALAVLQSVSKEETPPVGVWNVTTTAKSVNIREGSSTQSRPIGSIADGKQVTIIEWRRGEKVETNDWWGTDVKGAGYLWPF